MITLNAIQRTGCSLEKVSVDARGKDGNRQSQTWGRISDRAAKRGARKGMIGWLDQKATESATIAGRVFERATAAAKPQIQSASRMALQTAGDLSESLANQLLKISRAAKTRTLRNLPNACLAQLLVELEREDAVQSVTGRKPQSLEIQRLGTR